MENVCSAFSDVVSHTGYPRRFMDRDTGEPFVVPAMKPMAQIRSSAAPFRIPPYSNQVLVQFTLKSRVGVESKQYTVTYPKCSKSRRVHKTQQWESNQAELTEFGNQRQEKAEAGGAKNHLRVSSSSGSNSGSPSGCISSHCSLVQYSLTCPHFLRNFSIWLSMTTSAEESPT